MDAIYLHHSAVSYNDNPDQLESINEYHKQRFNMKSSLGYWVGYNYVVNKEGLITQTRADGEEQAAQKGFNLNSLSLCLEMNGDRELPTSQQIASLRAFLSQRMASYKLDPSQIKFHRDVADYKSCPGSLITKSWLWSELLKVAI